MTTTPNPTAAGLVYRVLKGTPGAVQKTDEVIAALRAAGLLGGDPTEEREKSVIAEIVTDSEIGERAAAIIREVLADRQDPTPDDRAATPSEPGLYADRLGNVWHLYGDGVFMMSSRIRASAAYYAPFKRLVTADAAGVAPQDELPVASALPVGDDSGHAGDDDRGSREDGPEEEGCSHQVTLAVTPSPDREKLIANYCPEHGDLLNRPADGADARSQRCRNAHDIEAIHAALDAAPVVDETALLDVIETARRRWHRAGRHEPISAAITRAVLEHLRGEQRG